MMVCAILRLTIRQSLLFIIRVKSLSTIDICQDMDIIQEIGGGIHNLGGTRYIEINGEIT